MLYLHGTYDMSFQRNTCTDVYRGGPVEVQRPTPSLSHGRSLSATTIFHRVYNGSSDSAERRKRSPRASESARLRNAARRASFFARVSRTVGRRPRRDGQESRGRERLVVGPPHGRGDGGRPQRRGVDRVRDLASRNTPRTNARASRRLRRHCTPA